jgi:hypothetical protein
MAALGSLCHEMDELQKAIALLRRALQICELRHGHNSAEGSRILSQIGLVFLSMHEQVPLLEQETVLRSALRHFQSSNLIKVELHKQGHPQDEEWVDGLYNIAVSMKALRMESQAQAWYQLCHDELSRIHGASSRPVTELQKRWQCAYKGHSESDLAMIQFTRMQKLINAQTFDNLSCMTDKELKEVFDKIDADGGGTLDKEELANAMRDCNKTEQEINELLDSMEKDELNFAEFKELMAVP